MAQQNSVRKMTKAICLAGLSALLGLALSGCSPGDNKPAAAPVAAAKTPAQQYEALHQSAKGIEVGPKVSDYTVYIMFDPQCLHCARLWEESQPLTSTVKFVWVPVNFFEGVSKAQAAALLGSANPKQDMSELMAAVQARKGPADAPAKTPEYLDAIVKTNTELINRFHVLAVPYIVARNQTTSQYVARQGGMSREMMKKFLGIGSR